MKVILDSNILVYAAKQKVDLVSQLRGRAIIIPNLVIKELENISRKAKKGEDKRAAKLALQMFSKNINLKAGHTDDRIIELAKKEKAAVATNDSKFRTKLKEAGIPIITLRQGKFIND